ncbi:helix-turn-helix domain-containing protein [Leptospira weilii]|uniref:helix-turn-helix domain-containing protein n=1 Tax=Leptospira weilii TaxID=28184 RepID=UPI0003604886|nr:helix-turn-helix transcriptional regulator [Leptospira weilii]
MRERILKLIEILKITNGDFALNIGISPGALSQYLSGKNKSLSVDTITSIKNTYNVNPLWLLTGEGEIFLPKIEPQDWAELEAEWERSNKLHKNPKLKKISEMLFDIDENDYSVVEELLSRFRKK